MQKHLYLRLCVMSGVQSISFHTQAFAQQNERRAAGSTIPCLTVYHTDVARPESHESSVEYLLRVPTSRIRWRHRIIPR